MRDFFADIDWSSWAEAAWTTSARVVAVIIIIYIALRILDRVLEPAIRGAITRQMVNDPKIEVEQRMINVTVFRTEVLEALKRLTGQNFGFEHEQWRLWYEENMQ